MKRLLIYLVIRMTTRHALNAVKIYETIYKGKEPQKPKKKTVGETNHRQPVISNKKEEVIQSLNYLKSKSVKSKQDKSSISMLEGVLATM